ncbi:competence protein ComFC [Paenibacillus shirakamiensis]|uniref:Competence protein ComFC n=1 Tax=Paenibacillus shirakamiensis TaxID=1265935 RepID=A0ABS4JJB8_9BACL|nr:ComF family protein [Paenibacillus shirakamiensis]MBP2001783.1 competence protein ComFC [Paenibacillus shirakamiensis]
MREWLAQYKYRGREAFTPIFQRMMGQAYKRMASELSGPPHAVSPWHIDAVTYVPLSPSRLRERGFNQAELLAIGAAAAAKAPLIDILERTRDTQKQSSKTRRERLSDMKSAFQLQPHAADVFQQILSRRRTLSKKNEIKILLIDDVYTTGSTLNYCSLALLQACTDLGISAQMYSLTWARS